MPLAKASAVPPSSWPTTVSKAACVSVPALREYAFSSGAYRYGAVSTMGVVTGAPGESGRPEATTTDSGRSAGLVHAPTLASGRQTRRGPKRDRGPIRSVPWAGEPASPRHRDPVAAGLRAAPNPARRRSTCAASPSRARRTSATSATGSASTSCGAGWSTAATRSPSSATSPTSTTRSSRSRPAPASRGGRWRSATSARSSPPSSSWDACRRATSRGRPVTSPEMIELMQRLIERGHAYVAGGDVYFDVRSWPAYGSLSGQRIDEMQAAGDSVGDDRKRDPRDFALWKAAKPGEPSWPTPWGAGRPGWHLECSAMATKYLGAELRHPRRRPGPRLPAPRERAGAVARGRRRLRQLLDAQRPGDDGRREDEQVAGQHPAGARDRARSGARSRCATTSAPRTTARPWSSRPRRSTRPPAPTGVSRTS